jgi:hypothetical protein
LLKVVKFALGRLSQLPSPIQPAKHNTYTIALLLDQYAEVLGYAQPWVERPEQF